MLVFRIILIALIGIGLLTGRGSWYILKYILKYTEDHMFAYKFPAVKGTQAGSEYYICMIPLGLLGRIFCSDDRDVSPEYRAQRRLNETRIPEIRDYILLNRDSYVFSALAASVDGEMAFCAAAESSLGVLEINLDASFLINDGQHRKAAILAALEE